MWKTVHSVYNGMCEKEDSFFFDFVKLPREIAYDLVENVWANLKLYFIASFKISKYR